ncbi:MAG: ATP-binding protein [Bryobacteraceae bacterium]
MELEKAILRRVGQAVTRFRMIRDGDRIAVGFSGGKDSFTLLSALSILQKRAPVHFSLCAFTIDQGKFLAAIEPFRQWMLDHNIPWTLHRDNPSLRLLSDQPDHGCDLCSRFRRRAVYSIARELGANVIAFGHTADDLCESFLRNAMFTGRLAALPPVAWSRRREFRLIRPLLYVTEDLTRAWAAASSAPVIPCGCSLKTGTVRRSLRAILEELEQQHPHLKSTLLNALGNIEASRLLDPRFFRPELDQDGPHVQSALPVFYDSPFTEL